MVELLEKARINYNSAVSPLSGKSRITFFLPSENSLQSIPSNKLQSLADQQLADVS